MSARSAGKSTRRQILASISILLQATGGLMLCCAAESGGSWGSVGVGGGCGGGPPQVRGTIALPALTDQDDDCSDVSSGTLE